MKAIVIGRHAPDFGSEEIQVVETRNVTFPATSEECIPIIVGLVGEADAQDAKLLFQNTPGQVAVALAHIRTSSEGGMELEELPYGSKARIAIRCQGVGVIVSKPDPRPAGEETFTLLQNGPDWTSFVAVNVAQFIQRLLPQAKVEMPGWDEGNETDYETTVTLTRPRQFVFSHIEWL